MILVTGGSGGVGSELLRLLSKAGIATRALARHPQRAQALAGITWIAGDLSRPGTLTSAFERARTLFLLTSYYEDMVELQHNAISAARAAGASSDQNHECLLEGSRARLLIQNTSPTAELPRCLRDWEMRRGASLPVNLVLRFYTIGRVSAELQIAASAGWCTHRPVPMGLNRSLRS